MGSHLGLIKAATSSGTASVNPGGHSWEAGLRAPFQAWRHFPRFWFPRVRARPGGTALPWGSAVGPGVLQRTARGQVRCQAGVADNGAQSNEPAAL